MKAEAVLHSALLFCVLITWQMFNKSLLNKKVAKWTVTVMREERRKGEGGGTGASLRSCQDGRVTEKRKNMKKLGFLKIISNAFYIPK